MTHIGLCNNCRTFVTFTYKAKDKSRYDYNNSSMLDSEAVGVCDVCGWDVSGIIDLGIKEDVL